MIDNPIIDAETRQQDFDAVLKRYQALEHRLAAEQRCAKPGGSYFQTLWRERQRLKGELARYDGGFRT